MFKYSFYFSFYFFLAHFLIILSHEYCVWLPWCSIYAAFTALSTMFWVYVSLIAIGVAFGWCFFPLLLLNFPRILIFSSLITLLHLDLSLDFKMI